MNQESRQCQNCHNNFQIEAEDFDFYKKINVPPPTWCPECRMIRRMAWRNARNLYKSPCKVPGHNEAIISVYSPEKTLVVYDQKYWWSQKHDPLIYGKPYDFSVPFFLQFAQLLREAPLPNLSNMNSVDSEYVNMTINSKNCYLMFSATNNENCSYCEGINECRDSLDLLASRKSERCYWCVDCSNCFSIAFSAKAISCSDSFFLSDCRNCSNCFGCWNLRNKQYCIFNEQYEKDKYFEKLKSFNRGSYAELSKLENMFHEKLSGVVHRFADIFHSDNVTGDRIETSHNCHNSFDIAGTTDSKYVWRMLEEGGSNSYDITVAGKPTLSYEGQGAGMGHSLRFSVGSGDTSYSQYIHSCISGCKYLFGCVGLTNNSYCILNKQYTKEEYEELVPRIIKHMNDMPYTDKKGRVYRYGEFFPPELSPFAYNETIAQEYFPLTKAEAEAQGYSWKEPDTKEYRITKQPNDLPDHVKDVTDDILKQTIGCLHEGKCTHQCTTAFRIIPEELSFYRKTNLPLPRLCPNCRHYERLAQRNPLKLWHRGCQCNGIESENGIYKNTAQHQHKEGRCPNEFETSYSPDRKEIVYCEPCYNSEVV